MPAGFYAVDPAGALQTGELLVFNPPGPLATFLDEHRYLPKGMALLKRVLALPSQTIGRTDHTFAVGGVLLSQALGRDRRNRPPPAWRGGHTVAAGEVFLINGNPRTRSTVGVSARIRSPPLQAEPPPVDSRGALTVRKPRLRTIAKPQPNPDRLFLFPGHCRHEPCSCAGFALTRWQRFFRGGIAVVALIDGGAASAQPVTARLESVATLADRFADFETKASQRFGIPASWIRAVMRVDSLATRTPYHPEAPWG